MGWLMRRVQRKAGQDPRVACHPAAVPKDPPSLRTRVDWRGWIALAWVLWWAWSYGLMAVQARSPQVIAWVRSLTNAR
jgi:hypothetical protein